MDETGQPGAPTPGENGNGAGPQGDPARPANGWAADAGWSGAEMGVDPSGRRWHQAVEPAVSRGWGDRAAYSPRPLPASPGIPIHELRQPVNGVHLGEVPEPERGWSGGPGYPYEAEGVDPAGRQGAGPELPSAAVTDYPGQPGQLLPPGEPDLAGTARHAFGDPGYGEPERAGTGPAGQPPRWAEPPSSAHPGPTSAPPAAVSGPPSAAQAPPMVTSGPPAAISGPPAVTSGLPAVTSGPPLGPPGQVGGGASPDYLVATDFERGHGFRPPSEHDHPPVTEMTALMPAVPRQPDRSSAPPPGPEQVGPAAGPGWRPAEADERGPVPIHPAEVRGQEPANWSPGWAPPWAPTGVPPEQESARHPESQHPADAVPQAEPAYEPEMPGGREQHWSPSWADQSAQRVAESPTGPISREGHALSPSTGAGFAANPAAPRNVPTMPESAGRRAVPNEPTGYPGPAALGPDAPGYLPGPGGLSGPPGPEPPRYLTGPAGLAPSAPPGAEPLGPPGPPGPSSGPTLSTESANHPSSGPVPGAEPAGYQFGPPPSVEPVGYQSGPPPGAEPAGYPSGPPQSVEPVGYQSGPSGPPQGVEPAGYPSGPSGPPHGVEPAGYPSGPSGPPHGVEPAGYPPVGQAPGYPYRREALALPTGPSYPGAPYRYPESAPAEPAPAARPADPGDVLPQRVPAEPDVPTVPEPPAVEPPAETPELARIATHLRREDGAAQLRERPDGFDVNAILDAVRGVAGVRDASLRTTPAGAHSLRLDLADGADPAEVSRHVARLLQERMGLAAAPQNLPGAPPPTPPGFTGTAAPTPPGFTGTAAPTPPGFTGTAAPTRPGVAQPRQTPPAEPDPRPQPATEEPRRRHQAPGHRGRATVGEPATVQPAEATRGGSPLGVQPSTGGSSYSGSPVTSTETAPSRPLNPGSPPGPRVIIDHVQVSTFGLDATVEVRLAAGKQPAAGLATGPAVDGYVLRLCAVAAAAAIDELLSASTRVTERGRCFVEHAAVVPFGSCEVATVVVLLVCDGWVEQLAGSALVSGDPRQAVVRATLAAVNRRLEALLT
ncbi:hypothetical protein GCM10022225_45710 [Plantactinospora mayteni]|uniref:Uncharacterized protein n=1 Tax=Plantactinospora mayteni TaxID=566021 RepID=A0ABQ4EXJ5_9ACTN|nr:hypothetical protein [Plantactinospora mayteni]GIG99351.1 hypothetical protein Pma05_59240 [Plantactinospora mayteni]